MRIDAREEDGSLTEPKAFGRPAADGFLLQALRLCLADRFPGKPLPFRPFDLAPPSRQDWEQAWVEAELFCARNGNSAADLPQSLLRWLDGSSFLPPLALLGELEPLLPDLHREGDPRFSLVAAFVSLWNRLHPFLPLSLAHARTGSQWSEAWLRADAPAGWPAMDLGWLLLPLLSAFPRAFSLPAFETAQTVADPRTPALLAEAGNVVPARGGLEVGSMRLAEPADPAAYFAESGLPNAWAAFAPALCVVQADYYCPRRRRVVLNAGCAYGAPWFLFKVGFRPSLAPQWNFLSKIIRHLRRGEDRAKEETATAVRPPRSFVYHRADDSISCDGRHLTRSVPARILRRLLHDFVRLGRREFEFRLFKRDPDIIANRKRSNFEVRLRRVEEVLEASGSLRLLHPRPGVLRLESSAPIDFREED